MTEKLYENDQQLSSCTAKVLSCEKSEHGWRIELDKTILFPEGGGQLCDKGTINGAAVTEVTEQEGRVWHLCEKEFAEDAEVEVQLDVQLRQYHSQQHTGEHMLSHAFWKLFGAKNIGFHSDENVITIDLDMELDARQCSEAELYANQQIWQNNNVRVLYRDREHMDDLQVRKVTEKVDGVLRVIAIDGGDVCTCCGTHVESTGCVGVIKIVSIMRHRGGTRLEAMCGSRALEDYAAKTELLHKLSSSLSCGMDGMEERIESIKGEGRSLTARLRSISAKLMDYTAAEALENCSQVKDIKCVMVPAEIGAGEAKQLLNRLTAQGQTVAGVFYPNGDRVGYMIAKTEKVKLSCREVAAMANGLLNGKGGGSEAFAQGSGKLTADWEELVHTLEKAVARML